MIVFPDPLSLTLDVLRASSATELQGARFGTTDPDPDAPDLPYVRVSLSTTDASEYPFREVAEVQLTVWAGSPYAARRLAQVARAVLTSDLDTDQGQLGSVRAGRGPFPGEDPDTGWPLAFVTVSLRLLPATL